MTEKRIKLHNKSDRPDNVVERENLITDECEELEAKFPNWMRGFFIFCKGNLLPMSRLSYLRELRFFCNYLISETEIKESVKEIKELLPEHFRSIKPVDVNIFLDYCRRYKLTDEEGTVTVYENGKAALSHKRSVLSTFFKYLYRDGFVEEYIVNGFDPIKMPSPGDKEIKALRDDEVMRMLNAAETGEGLSDHEKIYWKKTQKRDKLLLLLLVTYGLRLSELQQLNVSSFNFDRGEFKIYRKRGKESVMPINKTIEAAFDEYVSSERPTDDELEEHEKDALLLSMQGKRLAGRQIRQIVKKYTSIGMGSSRAQGYSPHKLRATAATSLIARGNSIYDVQELLDHDNVTTTQLYARHKLNTKKELIKNFEWEEDKSEPKTGKSMPEQEEGEI